MLSKPIPVDREININPNYSFNCKISSKGTLEFTSHILCEISGYEEYELINEPLISLAHPNMPKILFEVLTERLAKSQPMRLFMKLMAKDGRYYWLMMDFYTKSDQDGVILAHYSESVAAPQYATHKLQPLYKILSKIEEKTGNTKASRRYLVGFLEDRNLNYDQLIKELSSAQVEYKNDTASQFVSKEIQPQDKTQEIHHLKENHVNYNNNIDLSSFDENPHKTTAVVKKKSLFRRIFGW